MKLYFFESQIPMPLMSLPVRSTAIQLENRVILISPIEFTEAQFAQIRALGEVTDIVAPSLLHHLFMRKTIARFPAATVWGSPGFREKCPEIEWHKILCRDPWPYQNEIELLFIAGVPAMNEVAMYCKPLRALVVIDFCFNLKNPRGFGAKLILRLFGTYRQFAVSRLLKRLMKDRPAFLESMRALLRWDFDQIVMAHGEVLPTGGRAMLEKALQRRGLGTT